MRFAIRQAGACAAMLLAGCAASAPPPALLGDVGLCQRHVINSSNRGWVVAAFGGMTVFESENRACGGSACLLAPGTSAVINYVDPLGGALEITDYQGSTRTFGYTLGEGIICPGILHDGSTGAVVLNDPADGDIILWADSWNDGG